MRTILHLLALWSLLVLPSDSVPQEQPEATDALEAFKTELLHRTRNGSWWYTSNAEYRASENDADGYGVRHWLAPGGLSAAGCLWSIRGGAMTIVWTFYQGWDAAEGRPFVYQAHASGTGTGMGYEVVTEGGDTTVVQDFRWTDGTSQRVRHVSEWLDADTERSGSQMWEDGAWQPNRMYTWERRTSGPVACGPGAEGG